VGVVAKVNRHKSHPSGEEGALGFFTKTYATGELYEMK
jgi:hypothetical protein